MNTVEVVYENDSDEYEPAWYDIEDAADCWYCGGEGIIVTCWDDICNGLGYCIHGDGEKVCPECHGRNAW